MKKLLLPLLALAFSLTAAAPARALTVGDHRFSLTGGLVVLRDPRQTSFAFGAEYEYRAEPALGFGAQASHVFSDPSVTILTAPAVYLHPFSDELYLLASPVFYLVSGRDSRAGARLIAHLPFEIGFLNLTPTVGVDLIEGGPNYILALGISI